MCIDRNTYNEINVLNIVDNEMKFNMTKNDVANVLKDVKKEYETKLEPKEILLIGMRNVIIKCKIPGVTASDLAKASYGRKYKDAIAILKDQGTLTEIPFGKAKVIFLTDLIENAAKKYESTKN